MPEPDDLVIVETPRGPKRFALADELGAELAEQAEVEANRWIKALRAVRIDGLSWRDRFQHRGDSLWWFTELYFHKTRVVSDAFRRLFALQRVIERYRPTTIRLSGTDAALGLIANEVATASGVELAGPRLPGRQLAAVADVVLRGHLYVWRARLAALRAPARLPLTRARVAAFVHAAFWRQSGEQYTGPVLRELASRLPAGQLSLVGLGPRTSYRARTWKHRVAEVGSPYAPGLPFTPIDAFARPGQLQESREIWRTRRAAWNAVRRSPDVRRASTIDGCDLWPLLEPVFAGAVYLQFPWSAHVMDQIGAALDALEPEAAVTYAEAGGWGRALVLEARRRGVSTVGLQHGFIYRHWLNYLHEPDEMAPSPSNPADAGFPAPTRTLVYDRFAAAHLTSSGRFKPESVVITGSPRLDELAATAGALGPGDLDRLRQRAACESAETLVVVAAKYTQIARVFRDLVAAAAAIPGVLLLVKCHPAEGPEPYLRDAGGASSVRIADASIDLAELVRAARLLVTVNSTAALEAMVLGTPSLVLALPNNLSPFVEAGVMGGVPDGQPIEPALRAALVDDAWRASLAERAKAFVREYRMASDGLAASRAAAAILEQAGTAAGRVGIS